MSILDGPGPVTQPQAAPQAPATTNDPLNPTATSPQQGGFLNDLGVDWAGLDVSNEPAPGTYRCFLVKSEIRTKKDGTKSWVFSYRVNEGQPEEGKIKEDWRPLPQVLMVTLQVTRMLRLLDSLSSVLWSWVFPRIVLVAFLLSQLKGTECFVTIVLNNGYKNVTKVVLASEVDGSGLTQQPQGGVQGLI
jgi:hypothetical protein